MLERPRPRPGLRAGHLGGADRLRRCGRSHHVFQLGRCEPLVLRLRTRGTGLLPTAASAVTNAIDVVAGDYDACARLVDGTLACWGWGYTTDPANDRLEPVVLREFADVTHVALGPLHRCVVEHGDAMSCWGLNNRGQLGNGSVATVTCPPK